MLKTYTSTSQLNTFRDHLLQANFYVTRKDNYIGIHNLSIEYTNILLIFYNQQEFQ